MVLSEAEALARLETLRRQRDAIERQIADLLLYLDLGRRLGGPAPSAEAERTEAPASDPQSAPQPAPPSGGRERPAGPAFTTPAASLATSLATSLTTSPAFAPDEGEAGLSETVLARRYGRAVIEAALAVLEEAGRPLHASEILARITERGFSLPGQDPVAALNTRLWKRSGPGGPLKRLGEAVYAPAAEEG